jgi:tRNA A37 threonylcarbamoyladenosine modification protein TsaB
VHALCSHDALALQVVADDATGVRPGERFAVATDARRRELYWATYRDGVRVDGPNVSRPADIRLDGVEAVLGDGTHLYDLGRPVRDQPRYPLPEALAHLAAERIRGGAPSEPLTPLYLRRPDATLPGQRKTVLT